MIIYEKTTYLLPETIATYHENLPIPREGGKEAPPATRHSHRAAPAAVCGPGDLKSSLCGDGRRRPARLAQPLGDVVDPLGVHTKVGVANARCREHGDLRAYGRGAQ